MRRRTTSVYTLSRRSELEDRGRRQRQWAAAGRAKAAKRPTDHDVAQRDFRLNRTEKLAAKVRISERALERLEEVEKPFEGWQLQLKIAEAPASGATLVSPAGTRV